MAGTKEGGRKARDTKLQKDPDFFKKIGAKGGASHHKGGFASLNKGTDGLTGPERSKRIWEERKQNEDNSASGR